MRNPFLILSLVLLLGACSSAEKYAKNQSAADAWLASNQGKPQIQLDGAWEALEFGWGGAGRFQQSGNSITGALGNYSVRGVVNGSQVFLTFNSSGWTYYTAVLKMRGGVLGGFYSSSIPYSEPEGSLSLRRIGN